MEQQEATEAQRDAGEPSSLTQLKEQATEQAQGLAEQAQEAAESQKGRLADGARQVAEALHHASDGLRKDDQQTVGNYADALAQQVEKVAQFLQSRDLPTMAREVSGFARRQPALFLGGAFTLGIVAARFLKSSADGDGARRFTAGQEDARPDPSVYPPGGVPPLPTASGGGL